MRDFFSVVLYGASLVMLVIVVRILGKIKNISGMYDGGYKDGEKAARASFQKDFMDAYEKGVLVGRSIGRNEAIQDISNRMRRIGKSPYMSGLEL